MISCLAGMVGSATFTGESSISLKAEESTPVSSYLAFGVTVVVFELLLFGISLSNGLIGGGGAFLTLPLDPNGFATILDPFIIYL